jgi:HK97 family phage portal protein
MALLPFRSKKESPAYQGTSIYIPYPKGLPYDADKIAREAYEMNVICHAAVKLVGTAVAGVPWLLYDEEDNEITEHPILDLLEKPNRYQSHAPFFREMIANKKLFGNNYIEPVFPDTPGRPPAELYNLHPRFMKIEPGTTEKVYRYLYERNGKKVYYEPDEILHQKEFHPNDDFFGLPVTKPAAMSIDQNNESKRWNLNLLKNGAKLGGLLMNKGTMTPKETKRLKEQIREEYAGAENAGTPMVLEGEWTWQPITMNAQEMDWREGQKMTAREIALAFLTPPEMLGDSSNKTYSNYQESRKAFYLEAVLPELDDIQDELNWWLCPMFGEGLRLAYDKDGIEALAENRKDVWEAAIAAVKGGIITPNEAREVMQYDRSKDPEADKLQKQTESISLIDGRKPKKGGDDNGMQEGEEEEETEKGLEIIRFKKKDKR